MKKALVIGSNGYLGRHLSYFLKHNGYDVESYDLQAAPGYGQTAYQQLDLLNEQDLEKLDPQAGLIFMLAGVNGTHRSFQHSDIFIQVNEIALLNLMDWMERKNCDARLIFPSSRLVYRGKKGKLREEDEKYPMTVYAVNKLAGEQYIETYHHRYGLRYTIFRISLPFGDLFEDTIFKGNMGAFVNKAMNGEDIQVFGAGRPLRNFIHVEDLSRLMILASEHPETVNSIFNIGGEALSLDEVASIIADHFRVDVHYSEWPEADRIIETGDTVLDDSRLSSLVSYKYIYNFRGYFNGLGLSQKQKNAG